MSVELTKINQSCNNIRLLDSNECVGDSLSKINQAFSFFAKAQTDMIEFVQAAGQNLIPTVFAPISAKMLQTARLIDSINKIYLNAYTTIQVLSSQWNMKEFTIYFPQILDINQYYNNSYFFKENIRDTLLQTYFPAENIPNGQKINIYITLNKVNYFAYRYSGSYVENCSPTAHSTNVLTCNGCGAYTETRRAGCNIDGRRCQNAYNFCGRGTTSANGRYTCVGNISDTYSFDNSFNPPFFLKDQSGYMYINYNIENIEDMFLARIVKLKAVNQNNQWIVT
jgi:hypothetical protein